MSDSSYSEEISSGHEAPAMSIIFLLHHYVRLGHKFQWNLRLQSLLRLALKHFAPKNSK